MPLLDDIVRVAREAGDAILAVYRSDDFGTTLKDDRSPLTLADRRAHDTIVAALGSLTPDIPVLSEESDTIDFAIRTAWTRFWLVDPLDGTKEFLKHNDEFTVNIALIDAGRSVLGVVHAPALGVTYAAASGAGAWRTDASGTTRLTASDYRRDGLRVVASRSHAGDAMPRFLELLGEPPCVSKGSSLKFCLVAEGSANLYPRLGPTMEWDIGAAVCVVAEAGGSLTDLTGAPLAFNKPDLHNPEFVVCGNPAYPWLPVLERVRAESREKPGTPPV
jgi:3'(2'), 5'-bisphosphate nucleotidase